MELLIRAREEHRPGFQRVEVVERKGQGHPDSICDGIAEHVCVRLCREYLERFGVILHHNVDKVLLCGGAARPAFGGGEVVEPIEIYLAGRATDEHNGTRIPIHEIAIDACRQWLQSHIRCLDLDRDVRVISRLRPGSVDLTRMFARVTSRPLANDTSCGVGFAPLTDLERVVLAVEQTLNARDTKTGHPEIGEDIKVMGVRRDGAIDLTIACAFVDRFVPNLEAYSLAKATTARLALAAAHDASSLMVNITVNAADDPTDGEVYITVTGTSAEAGDDGEVGRGNRVSGLITPYRPMTIEAAAGKNPVTHVGKLYSLVASRIAASIARQQPDVHDVTCVLVSEIGRPADDPRLVDVQLAVSASSPGRESAVSEVVRAHLADLASLRDELLAERTWVY